MPKRLYNVGGICSGSAKVYDNLGYKHLFMSMTSGFQHMTSISDALEIFLGSIIPLSRIETVMLEEADRRVLAKNVIAPRDLPHYDRSMMDGYAVIASDLSAGVFLKLTTGDSIARGECMQVHTGSQIPKGPTRSS